MKYIKYVVDGVPSVINYHPTTDLINAILRICDEKKNRHRAHLFISALTFSPIAFRIY